MDGVQVYKSYLNAGQGSLFQAKGPLSALDVFKKSDQDQIGAMENINKYSNNNCSILATSILIFIEPKHDTQKALFYECFCVM